jgi:phospholipase C
MDDDSDGAYDHVMPPIVNDSQTVDDALTGPGVCGTKAPILGGHKGRCGYRPRLCWSSSRRGRGSTTSITR